MSKLGKFFGEWRKQLWTDFKSTARTVKFWVELFALIGLGIYTTFAALQWREMQKATEATKRALAISQQQLEATERPWLKIDFIPEPVTFQQGGMQFSMHAHITNIGHSVATGIIIPIKMFLASDANGMFKEPLIQQKELCDVIANRPVSSRQDETEIAVFPNGEDSSLLLGSGFSKKELEDAPNANPNFKEKHILPIIVGCVDYQYGASTHHHQTRFIYGLQRFDPATPPNVFTIEVGKDVPSPNVGLIRYAFGGFLAN